MFTDSVWQSKREGEWSGRWSSQWRRVKGTRVSSKCEVRHQWAFLSLAFTCHVCHSFHKLGFCELMLNLIHRAGPLKRSSDGATPTSLVVIEAPPLIPATSSPVTVDQTIICPFSLAAAFCSFLVTLSWKLPRLLGTERGSTDKQNDSSSLIHCCAAQLIVHRRTLLLL